MTIIGRCMMLFVVMLCISLFFSCTSEEPSGSSLQSIKYCIYEETRECFETAWTTCPVRGELSDFCPYNDSNYVSSSSIIEEPSSSSIELSSSSIDIDTSGTFIDVRDSKSYEWVRIGKKVWMTENLNYYTRGSKCYDNIETNCYIYGRLYNWYMAKTVCPSGWHLPSNSERSNLASAAGGSSMGGKYLKAIDGWNNEGNGEDKYGFAALPGGSGDFDGNFDSVGDSGFWWTASEIDSDLAYSWYMYYSLNSIISEYNDKGNFMSVRCVQDVQN